MKKTFLVLSVITYVLSSCKKDSECVLNSTSIQGSYKITASTIQASASSNPVDDYSSWDACNKDDIFTLGSNGIFSESEGAISCDPANDYVGQWSLSGNQLTLDNTDIFTISDFSCTSFKLTQVDASSGEITVTTMTKQ